MSASNTGENMKCVETQENEYLKLKIVGNVYWNLGNNWWELGKITAENSGGITAENSVKRVET